MNSAMIRKQIRVVFTTPISQKNKYQVELLPSLIDQTLIMSDGKAGDLEHCLDNWRSDIASELPPHAIAHFLLILGNGYQDIYIEFRRLTQSICPVLVHQAGGFPYSYCVESLISFA